jgi:hypothetical protein
VTASYIFGALAVIFLGLGASRVMRVEIGARSQGRIWLMIGTIFGLVSVWLLSRG